MDEDLPSPLSFIPRTDKVPDSALAEKSTVILLEVLEPVEPSGKSNDKMLHYG